VNKQKFIEYLRKPSQITQDQLTEIESLVKEYPYFQDGRTLLAKAKKALNPDHANKFISSAAVYVSDRAMLKKYLNQELFFLKPLKIEPEKEEKIPNKPTEAPTIAEFEKPQSEKENKQSESNEGRIQTAAKIDIVDDKKTETSQILENQNIKQTVKSDESFILPTKSTDNLDDLIAEIMRDVAELKQSKARFRAIEAKIEEEDAIKDVIIRTNTSKKKILTSSKDSSDIQLSSETKKKSEQNNPKHKPESNKKLKENNDAKSLASNDEATEVLILKKEEQEEIIKEFIKTEPQIKKVNPRKNNPSETVDDLADKSTRFHVDVTSEYLAEIYIGQGKHARAIEIYESLGLKFPEKSAYFAVLIKNLKKKL